MENTKAKNSKSSSHPLIELSNVTRIYGTGDARVSALKGIDICIENGEFVAIMGASGSGKSTCMNILGCMDTPTAGSYLFEGIDVGLLSANQRALLRRYYFGFVFQGFNLLNRTSALENVELPLIYRRIPAKKRKAMALEALSAMGLDDRWKHTPAELSGGQQQRVALARAMVSKPEVLFADEPTGNLDSARSLEVMDLLTRLNKENKITIIMVTHDPEMAKYATRQIVFSDGLIKGGNLINGGNLIKGGE